MLIGLAGELVKISLYRLVHTFDDKPDFTIGPEGIGGLDYATFRVIPWTDIQSIDRERHGLRIIGPERKANALVRMIIGKRQAILYPKISFKTPVTDILLAVRPYRPDLSDESRNWMFS
jgi:hypothetical protein